MGGGGDGCGGDGGGRDSGGGVVGGGVGLELYYNSRILPGRVDYSRYRSGHMGVAWCPSRASAARVQAASSPWLDMVVS